MRLTMTAVLAVTATLLLTSGLSAGEDAARGAKVPDTAVTSAAVQFVTQHHKSPADDRPRLSFDKPDIHPQDEPGKYAVIGGYMAFGGGKRTPHAYGLTMHLKCSRHDDAECWQLEKLLIDKELVVDK